VDTSGETDLDDGTRGGLFRPCPVPPSWHAPMWRLQWWL
jgi:hypothetical protein